MNRMKMAKAEMIINRDSGEVIKNRGNYTIECIDRLILIAPVLVIPDTALAQHNEMGDADI